MAILLSPLSKLKLGLTVAAKIFFPFYHLHYGYFENQKCYGTHQVLKAKHPCSPCTAVLILMVCAPLAWRCWDGWQHPHQCLPLINCTSIIFPGFLFLVLVLQFLLEIQLQKGDSHQMWGHDPNVGAAGRRPALHLMLFFSISHQLQRYGSQGLITKRKKNKVVYTDAAQPFTYWSKIISPQFIFVLLGNSHFDKCCFRLIKAHPHQISVCV